MGDLSNELLHLAMAVDHADDSYMAKHRERIAGALRDAATALKGKSGSVSMLGPATEEYVKATGRVFLNEWRFAD